MNIFSKPLAAAALNGLARSTPHGKRKLLKKSILNIVAIWLCGSTCMAWSAAAANNPTQIKPGAAAPATVQAPKPGSTMSAAPVQKIYGDGTFTGAQIEGPVLPNGFVEIIKGDFLLTIEGTGTNCSVSVEVEGGYRTYVDITPSHPFPRKLTVPTPNTNGLKEVWIIPKDDVGYLPQNPQNYPQQPKAPESLQCKGALQRLVIKVNR